MMPIISKSVSENDELASGYRIKLNYQFDDGTVKTINCRGRNSSSANEFLISKEAQVLASKKQQDLDKQIENDSDSPTNDTTQVEIYKAWMFKGYNSDDPIESYKYLSKVATKVLALNLTPQQLANKFGETLETVNLVLVKWQHLKSNKDILLAYKAVKGGM